jgi:DNA-binding CsgD family transcriptional regulator
VLDRLTSEEVRSTRAIGVELRCAERTVEVHVARLLSKADCSTRGELTARFWRVARQ